MARGWRAWGQRQAAGVVTPKEASGVERLRELSTPDDLVRRADWGRLPAAERTVLTAAYAPLPAPAPGAPATPRELGDDPAAQAWVTDLVAPHLQPEAVSVVRTWLADATPNTHLYVAGSPGRGRTSVTLALARRAMAARPTPPDFCYVPNPAALATLLLLRLPAGTATSFADALGVALHQITVNWEKPREKLRAETAEETTDEAARALLIGRYLEPVGQVSPDVARAYLDQLRAALEAQAGSITVPILVDADAPAGRAELTPRVGAEQGEPSGMPGLGAPVVYGSLARMDLTRALLRANGGVLVLPAADLVDRDQPAGHWAMLRALFRAGAVVVRAGEPAIPLDVRVALVGPLEQYDLLEEKAEDFTRFFRYMASFHDDVTWTPQVEAAYATLTDGVAQRYSLPPFDARAVARLVEEGSRRAQTNLRARLTTDLVELSDFAAEAGGVAATRGSQGNTPGAEGELTLAGITTTEADVEAALETRRTQHGTLGRRLREAILSGREIVPTTGAAVGQINGLSVYQPSGPVEARASVPTRLSATVSPGRERLVDIERESQLADRTHVSGALTMASYLAWRYGGERPLSLVARIHFEQGLQTGGNSASAAQLFALLSALAQVPIRRSLAITGVAGQHGEIQPIGGVNDKIEGFWQICRARRAQGEQPEGAYGVLIPVANAGDLMLRAEVVDAIASEGWFHVWPIADVDEGLALLTGISPAEIHARVDRRLQHFYELTIPDARAR